MSRCSDENNGWSGAKETVICLTHGWFNFSSVSYLLAWSVSGGLLKYYVYANQKHWISPGLSVQHTVWLEEPVLGNKIKLNRGVCWGAEEGEINQNHMRLFNANVIFKLSTIETQTQRDSSLTSSEATQDLPPVPRAAPTETDSICRNPENNSFCTRSSSKTVPFNTLTSPVCSVCFLI